MEALKEWSKKEVLDKLRPLPVHRRIRTLRVLAKMSQTDLADKLGVSRGSVSSWESAPGAERQHSPSPSRRDAMAFIFGIPAYVLTPDFGERNREQEDNPDSSVATQETVVPVINHQQQEEVRELPSGVTQII